MTLLVPLLQNCHAYLLLTKGIEFKVSLGCATFVKVSLKLSLVGATLVTLSPKAAPKCHLTMQENLIFFHFFPFWDMFSSKNVMNSKGFPFKNSICLSNIFVHIMCLGTIRAQILLSKIWAHLKGNIQIVKNNTKNSLVWPHPTVTMLLMLLTKCNIDKFNGGKFYSVTC